MNQGGVFDVFPWSDNFATGVAEIDGQHRRLVTLINRLAALLSEGAAAQSLEAVFAELADYAAFHFESEERYWSERLEGDEWLAAHRRTH